MNRLPLLLAVALAPLSACSSDEDGQDPFGDPGNRPVAIVQRIDLRTELGLADAEPIGVARDGIRTLIFDRDAGIHVLGQGRLLSQLPDPGVDVRLPFTDLAHLGGDRFAVTAIGDGFVLDTSAQTMQLHFCYEPGFQEEWQAEQLEQRTDAVAYDAAADTIYAQPQTYRLDDGSRTASSIATYDGLTGTLLTWSELDPEFTAGGIAASAGGLLLGSGRGLFRYDLVGGTGLTEVLDLGRYGIRNVSGIAIDDASLFVVDADTDHLTELDRALIGL